MADDTKRMPKRKRRKLAKAELYMLAAIWAQGHADEVGYKVEDGETEDGEERVLLPFSLWPEDDPLVEICETYHLSQNDLERLLTDVGQEMENRAVRLGY